jgi:hypothetical protein
LFLHVLRPEQEVVIEVPAYPVQLSPAFAQAVEALLGPGGLLVEHGRGA